MKIALRSPERFCGTAEQAWKILPNGLRELACGGRANQLHDLHDVFTIFVPSCCHLFTSTYLEYDWDIPRSIDAAFVVAGDLYLEGKFYQSVQMILFTAVLREFVSDPRKLGEMSLRCNTLSLNTWGNWATEQFAHIHHAGVNTRTPKLLRQYLGNVYPSEEIWKRKLRGSVIPSDLDNRQLFKHSNKIFFDPEARRRKLVTLFCAFEHVGPDDYQEVQLCDDSTLFELYKVYSIHFLNRIKDDDSLDSPANLRRVILAEFKGTPGIGSGCVIIVNYEKELRLLISANRSLKDLGIEEGDTITLSSRFNQFNDGAADVGAGNTVSQRSNEPAPRYAKKKKRNGKKTRKPKKSSGPLTAYQKPTDQQDKEAHSKKMESVLNELRPRLQQIRRKLDSLNLQRQLPKEKKGIKAICHDDKENIGNFANPPGAKAGKTVYHILVGLESNLYTSSKVGRNRKAISLDLHGLSKKQALKTLQENLPRWVDTSMKGEHPWVIPVNVICGGGSQELSEVVSTWIRRESQVANRPKSFM